MRYNMVPMANWVLFLVDCMEHFFDVHTQHAPALVRRTHHGREECGPCIP